MGQAGGAFDGAACGVQESPDTVDATVLHPLGDDFDRTADTAEDVVEVVRDPTGKTTERLQFLCVSLLLVEIAAALGGPAHAVNHIAVGYAGPGEPAIAFILRAQAKLEVFDHLAFEHL